MSHEGRVPGHVYRATRSSYTLLEWEQRIGFPRRTWTRWENGGSSASVAYRVVGVMLVHGLAGEAQKLIAALHHQSDLTDELEAPDDDAAQAEGGAS